MCQVDRQGLPAATRLSATPSTRPPAELVAATDSVRSADFIVLESRRSR
jgi:hypothetical protein